MGTGDIAAFRQAGRTLFSLGLIRDAEGNLSTWDGARLRITRTGARLFELDDSDVVEGSLEEPPDGASSDLGVHASTYRREGAGAIAHAHPPGSVPDGWVEGQPHGRYVHATTLDEAVRRLVADERTGAA